MTSKLSDLTRLVDEARAAGARASEVLLESTSGVRMTVLKGKVVDDQAFQEDSLTIRCWLEGGREAEVTGAPGEARSLIVAALEAAGRAPEDPHAGPASRAQPTLSGLGIDDRRYGAVEREDRLDVLISAERSVRAEDRRLTPEDFRYEDQRRWRAFANSRGVALEEHDTAYRASGRVRATYDGDDLDLDGGIEARSFASIASFPYGTNVARRAAGLLQRGERLQGEVLVMMPPVAVARLFAELARHFTHEVFQAGEFFLRPRPDGRPVVDPVLHLVDDGALPGGYRTRSFDDQGSLPVALTLLREGRPDGRFVDARTARRIEARPTGHATRGGLRPSNLFLRTGTRSMNAIFTDRDTWTFLLDDLPDPIGLDPRTGDLVARVNGQVMKSNEVKGAMRNVTLRGNLLTVLNRVEDLASDTDRHGHVDAPGMLVGGFVLEG